jgi:cobalt-zinc-cadmium efflux system protein
MGAGHSHDHAPADFGNAFAIGIVLNLAFVAVEAVYGLVAGSMALLADAGHNLSDVLGLVLAWGGAALVKRRPNHRFSYGLKKSSILAALLNALLLLVAVGAIIAESIRRLSHPEPTDGNVVIAIAAAGILVNGVTAWLFARGRKHDINIRGAYLHMAADAGVSAGVVLAGLAIRLTGWLWLDPAASLAIAAVIALGTWGLLKDSLALAIDAVPHGIDPRDVERHLLSLEGVVEVHDLHIWPLSTTATALTVHLVQAHDRIDDDFTARVCRELADRFGIGHATVQFETGRGAPCALEPDHVV